MSHPAAAMADLAIAAVPNASRLTPIGDSSMDTAFGSANNST
jgi:hypothetical protein